MSELIEDPYLRAEANRAAGPGPDEAVGVVPTANLENEEEFELYMAMMEREQLRVCPYGPLTKEEQAAVDSYEQYQIESAAEYEAAEAAGGRTICPECGERSVVHSSVITLGYEGHPGAERSAYEQCEKCDYRDLA